MVDEETELLEEFILETREHLSEIEPDLLAMEQQGENVSSEIINRVFRAVHSTKGGASFLSFDSLKNFSHTMENVLMLIRDGKQATTPDVMDVLLRAVDILRAMIDDVQNSEHVPHDKETEQLNAILEGKPVDAAEDSAPVDAKPAEEKESPPQADAAETSKQGDVKESKPEKPSAEKGESVGGSLSLSDVPDSVLKAALSEGMHFYFVTVKVGPDLFGKSTTPQSIMEAAKSIGKFLGATVDLQNYDAQAAGRDATFEMLCATVLTADMACVGLNLPEEQFRELETKELKERFKQEKQVTETQAPEKTAAGPEIPKKTLPKKDAVRDIRDSNETRDVKETLRVRVDLLTRMMNMAGELVLGRNQLLRALDDVADGVPGLVGILQHVDRVTTELQEGIMQTRMQPIGILFGRYKRVVRDLARSLGKDIELYTEGSEVELDKSIIEMLADPLTHIVRNCVDHAIEQPDERESQGKARRGKISLLAFHESGQVNIVVSDDGRGINRDKVLAKAIEKGMVDIADAENMSDHEIMNLVLAPGFSTADKVSDISGRGVGMDVVRTNIEKLGGHIDMNTEEGVGTSVMLRLPLTLAIIPSLVVGVGDSRFAVPQVSIVELVWVRAEEIKDRIEMVQGAPVLRLRGRLLPLVRLANILGISREIVDPETGERIVDRRQSIVDERDLAVAHKQDAETAAASPDGESDDEVRTDWRSDYNILVLRAGSNLFGVIVDELFETEEIVVKPLSSYLKEIKSFAGTTILGDGRVIMILDPGGIAELANLRFSAVEAEQRRREKGLERGEGDSSTVSIILFDSAPDEVFAVPQEKVLRLERIRFDDVQRLGQQEYIKYRGAGLPVVRLENHIPVEPIPDDLREMYLLIPKHFNGDNTAEARGGILVSKIIDAMDIDVRMQDSFIKGPGLQGAAIVNERLTVFLDPVELLDATGVIGGQH